MGGCSLDMFRAGHMPLGELLVLPKMALTWPTTGLLKAPILAMIEEGSEEATGIRQNEPDIDLGLHIGVRAREAGTMLYRKDFGKPVLCRPDAAADDDGPSDD